MSRDDRERINMVLATKSSSLYDLMVLNLAGQTDVRVVGIVGTPFAVPQVCLDSRADVVLVDDVPGEFDAVQVLGLLRTLPDVRRLVLGSAKHPERWAVLIDAGAERVVDRWRDLPDLPAIIASFV